MEGIRMKRIETDLHLHLDGSLPIETVKILAEQAGYDFHGRDIKSCISVGDSCESLPEYLKCFEVPGILLQTEGALELASYDLVKCLAQQGVVYAEIRFAPQLHKNQGLSQEKAVEAVIRGSRKACDATGIFIGILLCDMVTGTNFDNEETFDIAKGYLGKGVVGADIAGAEGAVPMSYFEPLFRRADRAGLPFTIHAGECGDYENVAKAVSYGAKRIGHGCAAVKSEACMDLLIREKITLEMCVISNLQTKAVKTVKEHPLKAFYDRGIRVTYNTDNMTVSDTSLAKEAGILQDEMGFVEADLVRMNRYAVEAAFAGIEVKKKLLELF